MADQAKRNATFKRYHEKTYERYAVTLRKIEDAELIQFIESEKASGGSPTTAVRKLYANRKGE